MNIGCVNIICLILRFKFIFLSLIDMNKYKLSPQNIHTFKHASYFSNSYF